MKSEVFISFLELIEGFGIWLSLLAWFTVFSGTLVMFAMLTRERRKSFWKAAILITMVALTANLSDFFITFIRSPDLGLEVNPLWRNVTERWGVSVAWWYGFSGKILLSVLAGLMYAYYLLNRERLYPEEAGSLFEFVRKMGNRSNSLSHKMTGYFTLFCFFFATIQIFYFYVAFLNWVVFTDLRYELPSVLWVLFLMLLLQTAGFFIVTFRAFKNRFR